MHRVMLAKQVLPVVVAIRRANDNDYGKDLLRQHYAMDKH